MINHNHTLDSFIGKRHIINAISVGIKASKKANKALDHILFYGPPGVGKTSLSYAIAKELGVSIKVVQGINIQSVSDMLGILSSLKPKDLLFIDEIHSIKPEISEVLYPALESKVIDLVVGRNLNKRSIRIPLPDLTVIASTTNLGNLTKALEDRFGYVFFLDVYTSQELELIIKSQSKELGFSLSQEDIKAIVESSKGIPRNAMRILKRINDHYLAEECTTIPEIIKECGFLHKGLNIIDIKYLEFLKNSGNASLSSIRYKLNIDEKTILYKIEPYLFSNNWINKNSKGRFLTPRGLDLLSEVTSALK